MLKKIGLFCVVLGLTASSLVIAAAPVVPEVYALSAYMMDADTGEGLYAKAENELSYPGSTTKIMTGILGLELGKSQLDQPLKITSDIYNIEDASVLGIAPGDQITLREAMKGMMIVSGCDVAVAVAETVTPSEWNFVQYMNWKARDLGAVNTHFNNVHGLPDDQHYTTAKDMAIIAAYAMKNPTFRDMVNKPAYDVVYMDGHTQHVTSTNYFLTSGFSGANGIKTGTTNAAGPCLIASATRNGKTLVAATMNSADRFRDAQTLLGYGFNLLSYRQQQAAAQKAAQPVPVQPVPVQPVPVQPTPQAQQALQQVQKQLAKNKTTANQTVQDNRVIPVIG